MPLLLGSGRVAHGSLTASPAARACWIRASGGRSFGIDSQSMKGGLVADQSLQVFKGAYEAFTRGDVPAALGALGRGCRVVRGRGDAIRRAPSGSEAVARKVFGPPIVASRTSRLRPRSSSSPAIRWLWSLATPAPARKPAGGSTSRLCTFGMCVTTRPGGSGSSRTPQSSSRSCPPESPQRRRAPRPARAPRTRTMERERVFPHTRLGELFLTSARSAGTRSKPRR